MHSFVEDITPYMDGARIAIAPLRFGAGVKGKINLSMAHGQPVVGTTCAVEGMHLHLARTYWWPMTLPVSPMRWSACTRTRSCGSNCPMPAASVAEHFSLDAARATVQRVFFA